MFVLDTDILTLLFAGHSQVVSRRDQIPSSEIATTIVSRIQSLQGRFQFILKAATGDLLIAAIALANRATLVTRNVKDFRQVPGLKVENWAD
jgi:tRNA(fMet)-specific endonuclease VapC